MNTVFVRPLGFLSIAFLLAMPVVAIAEMDYVGIAQSYNQWTVSTVNTAAINAGLERQTGAGSNVSAVAWPAINEADIERVTLDLHVLQQMRRSDFARMRSLLDGRLITVEGVVGEPHGTAKVVSIQEPGSDYMAKGRWRGHAFSHPAVGSRIQMRGIAKVRSVWVEFERPDLLDAGHAASDRGNPDRSWGTPAPGLGNDEATFAHYDALKFSPSPEGTRRASALLTETLAPILVDGSARNDLEHLLNSGGLQGEFERALGSYGFSSNDFADVFSGAMVLAWQVANHATSIDASQKQGVVKVRDGFRDAFARTDWLPRMSDEDKHMLSETLVLGSMLIATRYLHARQGSDQMAMDEASRDAHEMMTTIIGVDLRDVVLTGNGFVAR